MEEFLKDSPSEFSGQNSSNNYYNNGKNNNRGSNRDDNSGLSGGAEDPTSIAFESQDFGFDLSNNMEQFDNSANNFGTFGDKEYIGQQTYMGGGNTLDTTLSNDPFLDDIDNLNFQSQPIQPQYVNPSRTSNLDEIVSPDSGVSFQQEGSFLDSQYFSPPNRGNVGKFNGLDSIAEDGSKNSFNNALSPSVSRQDGINVPTNNQYDYNLPDVNGGSYLSPSANPQYISPNNNTYNSSYDTLRSPNFNSNSYLVSSPQFQASRMGMNSLNNNVLSPPPSTSLSSSAPNNTSPQRDNISTKQLSKEEKLKRRREFHNAVERRRRDLIKERIKELGLLVPPSLLNPQLSAVQSLQRSPSNNKEISDILSVIKVKETKPNKSTILNKSVDYINHLKYVLDEQQKARAELETKIKKLEINGGQSEENQPPNEASSQPDSTNSFNPDDFFSDIVGGSNANNGISSSTNNFF